jgi:hypothetical protein
MRRCHRQEQSAGERRHGFCVPGENPKRQKGGKGNRSRTRNQVCGNNYQQVSHTLTEQSYSRFSKEKENERYAFPGTLQSHLTQFVSYSQNLVSALPGGFQYSSPHGKREQTGFPLFLDSPLVIFAEDALWLFRFFLQFAIVSGEKRDRATEGMHLPLQSRPV